MRTKNKFTIAKSNDDIKLDVALRVVNWNGCILNKEILKKLIIGDIVRISMHISKKSKHYAKVEKDAPYVLIKEQQSKYFLGEILDMYRALSSDSYPLRTGEHIWFSHSNIIEIPINKLERQDELYKFCTNEYVCYTGPLDTIDQDSSEDESDSDSSNSELNSVDISKFDDRINILRDKHTTR